MGAKLASISPTKRIEAAELAKKIRYVELAGDPRFISTFAKSMRLGN
jgi:uncharacterized 2Fe-2S/4Fe-4S cluster protein (DUF4445 family)